MQKEHFSRSQNVSNFFIRLEFFLLEINLHENMKIFLLEHIPGFIHICLDLLLKLGESFSNPKSNPITKSFHFFI